MSMQLRLVCLLGIAVYFITIIKMLKKKNLELKYMLSWLLWGIVMLSLVAFPQILVRFSEICHIEVPSNGLFSISIFGVFIILISLTSVISVLSERNKKLAQDLSLLEYRIRQLEQKVGENDGRKE